MVHLSAAPNEWWDVNLGNRSHYVRDLYVLGKLAEDLNFYNEDYYKLIYSEFIPIV